MRGQLLLAGGLVLLLGCSNKGGGGGGESHAPPPLKKELLTGKWKNESPEQLISHYEFARDGTLKMHVQKMDQPIPGHYSWTDERKMQIKLEATPQTEKGYSQAAKAFKDHIRKRIEDKSLSDRAGPSILGAIADELPATSTVTVSISEQPLFLTLTSEDGKTQRFEKAD